MSCKALKLKGCEIKGSTFQGRKFSFPNRDISGDVFTLKIPKLDIEIIGSIIGNDVFFSYATFESYNQGLYVIEFWANFEGIGTELIAEETFIISIQPCGCSETDNTSFVLEFPEETINYTVDFSVVNIGFAISWSEITDKPGEFPPSPHTHTWSQITDKPVFFSGAYEDLTGKPVLFSGNYNDLSNKPTIPNAQVNSDWNASGTISEILNKPTLFNGTWSALTGKPTTFTPPIATETVLGGVKVWFGTQAQYDAIITKQTDTLYYIQS